MRAALRGSVLGVTLIVLAGCSADGGDKGAAGVVAADGGPWGPAVIFDPLQRPVPDIPFPNDLLLTPSDTTASGARWNISTEAPTHVERRLRGMLDTLDGFSPSARVHVSFDGPLDLATVTDATVLIINIEPDHPREGEIAPLDLGRGFFPETMEPTQYWAFDPMVAAPDLILPPDNQADSDGDGDVERVSHYEVSTHTLVLKPIFPLAQAATHAVLITRGVHGDGVDADGQPVQAPVRSPFPYKAHAAQSELVARALDLAGLDKDDLAFGWTYTTSDIARPMLRLRAGVNGAGVLKRLGDDHPPVIAEVRDLTIEVDADLDPEGRDHRYILQGEWLNDFVELFGQIEAGISFSYDHVDYMVFGSFHTPDVRTGEARTLGLDTETGKGEVGEAEVPFLLSVPKSVPGRHEPPFPVMIYFHGTATSRMEALGIADQAARQGIAVLSIDQVGHGPIIPDLPLTLAKSGVEPSLIELLGPILAGLMVPEMEAELVGLSWQEILEAIEGIGLWAELARIGRTTDENGDGALESGEAFFFADPFRQCASFQQDMVDAFHVIRALRALDQAAVPPGLDDPSSAPLEDVLERALLGDFNADGVLDIGGPDVQLSTAGTSLGGFHAIMLGALAPEVTVSTPIVAGGGFLDVMTRSGFWSVLQRIWLEVFGPLVVGCPDGAGGVWLSFNDDTERCKAAKLEAKSFAHVPAVGPGDLILVDNLDNGESAGTWVSPLGGFSLAVPSDRWDQLQVRVLRLSGDHTTVPVVTPFEGVGLQRNTPRFRRFIGVSEHVLGHCDPINFANALFREPYEGHPPTNILFENALGDDTVPIASGVAVALASGVLGADESEWRPLIDTFISQGVMIGSDYDVDDLLEDNPPGQPAVGPLVPVQTGTGGSSIRFADVHGWHEWIVGVDQSLDFDRASYTQAQIALYHWSGGTVVVDDLCIDRHDCPLLDDPTPLLDSAGE